MCVCFAVCSFIFTLMCVLEQCCVKMSEEESEGEM